MVILEITEKECVKEKKRKIRFVQHCAAISATGELFLCIDQRINAKSDRQTLYKQVYVSVLIGRYSEVF